MMPLTLVPPRKGWSHNYRIRGTIYGQYVDTTTGTSDAVLAEAFRFQKEMELYLKGQSVVPLAWERWPELALLLPLVMRRLASLPAAEREVAKAWILRTITDAGDLS